MTYRSIIVLLVVGLISTWAVAVKGGKPNKTTLGDLDCVENQIAKFDRDNWQCSEDQAGSAKYYVVDSENKEVGQVISFKNLSTVIVKMEVNDNSNNLKTILVEISEASGFLPNGYRLGYTEFDCKDTPYITAPFLMGNFPSLSDKPVAILWDTNLMDGNRDLWLPQDDYRYTIYEKSYSEKIGLCRNWNTPLLVEEAAIAGDRIDLDLLYPGPYDVVER
jgi:hypothetical protein